MGASTNGVTAKVVSLRCNPNEEETQYREYRGKVFYDEAGMPIVLELRCKNRECCPRVEGHYAVHWFTLYGVQNGVPVGRYVTKQLELGDISRLTMGAGTAIVSATGPK